MPQICVSGRSAVNMGVWSAERLHALRMGKTGQRTVFCTENRNLRGENAQKTETAALSLGGRFCLASDFARAKILRGDFARVNQKNL